jgi:hypothetical protein
MMGRDKSLSIPHSCMNTMANMPKKPINSATINYSSRNRSFHPELLSEEGISPHVRALRSLRLWTFFSTFVILFLHATLGYPDTADGLDDTGIKG